MNEPHATLPPCPRPSIALQAASCMQAAVVLFDVARTLVDAVWDTLRCWHESLSEVGHDVPVGTLSRLSGLNGPDMLARLLMPGMPVFRRCQARLSHDPHRRGVESGLEVSLCGLGQDQLVQRQV